MRIPTIGRKNNQRRRQQGFSLIELLIVVAIILIIAAIAVPNLLRARISANEAAAASGVRTVTTAAMSYSSTYGNGYPPDMATMGGAGVANCNQAILLDPLMTNPPNQEEGFIYGYTAVGAPVTAPAGCAAPGASGYLVTATPASPGVTGVRSFCSYQPGVIHFDNNGATAASQAACEALPPLQ
ncbi:MAG: prepilin-type N-terminal cleavage/methylation domain-containing protein [Acidobacteriia bacterium]|nr:prepilin-type N-terminal cleavage/methylation domain-containing protein [Terriglobia bacterium]